MVLVHERRLAMDGPVLRRGGLLLWRKWNAWRLRCWANLLRIRCSLSSPKAHCRQDSQTITGRFDLAMIGLFTIVLLHGGRHSCRERWASLERPIMPIFSRWSN